MAKIDLKREMRHLYKPSAREVSVVDVPGMNFLMIDGSGDPNTAVEFQDAIEALYGVSYTAKFMLKKREVDFVVMPLEFLLWTDDMGQFSIDDKDAWKWTLMLMQPDQVTEEIVTEATKEVERKKNPPALSRLRFEGFHEGLSAQIMHIGPYSAELPTIKKLHKFIEEDGHKLAGKHHEIYLGNPNRTAPERLKTVIRQPMRK